MEECKMEKIFAKADEKYLKRVELFATGDNTVLYYDSAKSKQKVPFEGLLEMLKKDQVVINVGDVLYNPVSFKIVGQAVEVYCCDMTSTPTKKTYKSDNKISQ